jgi:hypothetical protein
MPRSEPEVKMPDRLRSFLDNLDMDEIVELLQYFLTEWDVESVLMEDLYARYAMEESRARIGEIIRKRKEAAERSDSQRTPNRKRRRRAP